MLHHFFDFSVGKPDDVDGTEVVKHLGLDVDLTFSDCRGVFHDFERGQSIGERHTRNRFRQ